MDGAVVVKVEMNGEIPTEGSQGHGLKGTKELSGLLSDDPGGTRKETGAHGTGPNADKERARGSTGGISIVAGCRGGWCGGG